MQKRNTSISIVKAIAIILVCMGHAEGPARLMNFIYLFHMPVFFITAGYFFTHKHAADPWTFCKKRVKGLYFPFVKWSLFFLLIHNLLFKWGILNEQYGNEMGGVTHPYSFHAFMQRLFNIVFSMAGYDEFMAGAFWFFRALFIVSIAFLVLYLAINGRKRWITTNATLAIIAAFALTIAALKIGLGLRIVTIVQGGIRECWGLLFFAFGMFYRQHEACFKQHWAISLGCLAFLILGACLGWHGMTLAPVMRDVATLPLTGIAGFLLLHNAARWLDRHEGIAKRALVYCGDNTLYVFVFHIAAFKLVSALKIWYYGLDWGQIGCHMVIHYNSTTDLFWLLYTVVGTALPLAWSYGYLRLKRRLHTSR